MKMNSSFDPPAAKLAWYLRALLSIGGGMGITLLIVAASLRAESRGYGTHQQLGLPPCSFKMLTGIRCPSCGMTTSWTLMTHGRVIESIGANAGGALLAILAATAGPWSLISGLRGRWFGTPPHEWLVLSASVAVMVVTLFDWAIRLLLFG